MAGISTGISLLGVGNYTNKLKTGLSFWLDGESTTDSTAGITPFTSNNFVTSATSPVSANLGSYQRVAHGSVRYNLPSPIDVGGTFGRQLQCSFWVRITSSNFTNSNLARLILLQNSAGTDISYAAAKQVSTTQFQIVTSTCNNSSVNFNFNTWYYFVHNYLPANAIGNNNTFFYGDTSGTSLTNFVDNAGSQLVDTPIAKVWVADAEFNNASSGMVIEMDSVGIWNSSSSLTSALILEAYNAGKGVSYSQLH